MAWLKSNVKGNKPQGNNVKNDVRNDIENNVQQNKQIQNGNAAMRLRLVDAVPARGSLVPLARTSTCGTIPLIIWVRTFAFCLLCSTVLVHFPSTKGWCQTPASGERSVNDPAVGLTSADSRRMDRALAKAAEFLISKQTLDGSITDKSNATAMTSLSIMALASIGHVPGGNTSESAAVRRAIEFVLDAKNQTAEGYFGQADNSRMYGHGITTLMLTEMLGMGATKEQDDRIAGSCRRGLDLIQSAQRVRKPKRYVGGWRYTPSSNDSDLSISVWQLMALRSAKNDGEDIPNETIDLAVEYLRQSFTGRLDSDGQPIRLLAGFSYEPNGGGSTFAMTAAGLLAMQVCGQYDSPITKSAADWLLERPPSWNEPHALYGTYYYSQAMHQRGGKYALAADQALLDFLLPTQRDDGAFVVQGGNERAQGEVYSTALAMLSLSVNHHFLPIYQR